MCHFEITKSDVDNKNFNNVDIFIKKLKSFGTVARQKVLFSFAGYDNDKRELIYIPEVIRYTKELLKRYPFFWYYATPVNSEFFILAALLDEKNSVIVNVPLARNFHVKQDAENIKSFLYNAAVQLSIFGEQINDIDGAVKSLEAWSVIITRSL